MTNVAQRIKSAIKDAVQSSVLVRARCSFGNDRGVFEPGCCYLLPASEAAEWAKAGLLEIITDEFDRQACEREIHVRESLV